MSLEFPQGTRFECFALGDLRLPLDLGESTPLHTRGNLGLNTWLTSCEANLRRCCSLAQSRALGPVFVLPFFGANELSVSGSLGLRMLTPMLDSWRNRPSVKDVPN